MKLNNKPILAAAAAVAVLMPLAACGSTADNSATDAQGELSGNLTIWGWGNGMQELADGFEKLHPGVKVKYNNTGTASDTAVALQNAIAAGSGAPDVVNLQGTDVSQFAVAGSLVDLSKYGADKLADEFAQGPWRKLQYEGKPYGLPIDSGPMAFFYNDAVFKKAGVDGSAIKTWDDYYEAAKKIHALGPDYYITNNSGNTDSYSEFNAMLWQAGAKPWKVEGENISINLDGKDEATKKVIDFQQKLIDEGLVNTSIGNWSEDWNRSLNDGTTASLAIGAWMPTNLESSAPDQKGNWRVALMPQWEEGDSFNAEDGGSAYTIPEQTKNKDLAWEFVKYAATGEGEQIMVDKGGIFPALLKTLNSEEFKSAPSEYFGGQKINEVLAEAANMEVSEFQFLPFSTYAQSQYGDFLSPAYQGKKSYADALKAYQKNLEEYASGQGYTVK